MHRYAICCVALFNSCMPKYQLLLSHWLQRVCQAAAWQLVFNFCRYYGKIGPQKGGKRGCAASNHRDMPSIALPFKWWKPEFISTFQFVSAPPLACPSSHVDAPDGLKAPTSRELTCAPCRTGYLG